MFHFTHYKLEQVKNCAHGTGQGSMSYKRELIIIQRHPLQDLPSLQH